MPDIRPLRPGDPERLGGYRLTGLLGEGGQGAVYLAEDEPGHRVAVKLLHARFSADPKARSRFAAEVAVAQRVSAFCTARILDSDVEGDRPYIVSEYIDGPSLSAALAEGGPQRGADLDRLAIGTMTALVAIHQAGVVHRDFKPANVLLAADGPRVIDFGIARALDATGTLSSTAVGTPAYMAPEQISGAPVGPAADVFAWGATMAVAATGRPAFGQDSIPAVMHRILNMAPDLGMMPEPLRGVVADCLSKDPALRPASQQVLATLLTLAGNPPKPGGGGGEAMLSQGAETAAADSARLQDTRSPSNPLQSLAPQSLSSYPQLAQHPQSPLAQTPPPPASPFAQTPPPSSPFAQTPPSPASPFAQTPPPQTPYAQTPPGPQPPSPPWAGPSGYAGQPTWPSGGGQGAPSGTDRTGPPGTRRRRRIGVLAGAGGAAAVAVAVATTLIIVLSNGGDHPSPRPTGRVGGTLRIAAASLGSTSGEIDPSHAYTGTERFLAKLLFTGLTEVEPDGTARNRLATSIKSDGTCSNWTIGIREGTTFSDGSPVDAAAFQRGWTRAARTSTGGGPVLMADIAGYADASTGQAGTLSGVSASGSVIDVHLTSPSCDFPKRLGDPAFAPLPQSAGSWDNASYNQNPVGNGPFKLQGSSKGRSYTLVRNDRWAFGKTKLDTVQVNALDDTTQGRATFASGGTDWAPLTGATGAAAASATSPSGGTVVTRTLAYTRMLVPVTARGPMKSRDARLAVSYALDRSALAGLYGTGYAPAHGIVPAALPGFGKAGVCPSCDAPDTVKAKELASKAGLGSGTRITLYLQQTSTSTTAAEAVQARLRQVLGWSVELKTTPLSDWSKFRQAVTADDASGLALFAWGPDYPSPYTSLWSLLGGTLVGRSDGYNLSGWKNSSFDGLISNAVRTPSDDQRTRLYQQAEKTALDDMALIPLVYTGTGALASDRFVNLRLDYDGDPTVATAALK
ncbi:Serine/threonine-protein kinase PknD [Actinomadura sp. RB99]|uniref:ABC transporter substrate-binding protein n=1 Tax=Actinomadura sp. RB99 TaxID=2691577 RepID=UPI0016876EF0|nr:ABC transporter substrate-binding protein [Actinomadura sp. RB99]MBD2895943.1 Serine/threonine-protein kinase PknD [Actinomadura sp. RB99]